MEVRRPAIPAALLRMPKVFKDVRGLLCGNSVRRHFEEVVAQSAAFVVDNHSKSMKDVLLGLQDQLPPKGRGSPCECCAARCLMWSWTSVATRRPSASE